MRVSYDNSTLKMLFKPVCSKTDKIGLVDSTACRTENFTCHSVRIEKGPVPESWSSFLVGIKVCITLDRLTISELEVSTINPKIN
jgi:hypothetical protein